MGGTSGVEVGVGVGVTIGARDGEFCLGAGVMWGTTSVGV